MSIADHVIDVKSLKISYGRGARATEAVRDISFTVSRGETVGCALMLAGTFVAQWPSGRRKGGAGRADAGATG